MARLKNDLVAAVSHELKTLLASMRLLIDTLLADDEPDRSAGASIWNWWPRKMPGSAA